VGCGHNRDTPHRIGLVSVFHRPLKISVVVLVLAGVAMAMTGAVAAFSRQQSVNAAVFVTVAVILAAVAILIVREVRWVIAVCFVVLAGQVAAIVGTTWELTHGIAAVKARQLQGLGFDPTTAVVINLIYSSIGFGLFCWLAWRWWSQRRQ
jgi:hypothetical protein